MRGTASLRQFFASRAICAFRGNLYRQFIMGARRHRLAFAFLFPEAIRKLGSAFQKCSFSSAWVRGEDSNSAVEMRAHAEVRQLSMTAAAGAHFPMGISRRSDRARAYGSYMRRISAKRWSSSGQHSESPELIIN